jgi:diguanylate cyclase (GGDEF)-like protein
MKLTAGYTLIGILLGIGGPAGALVLRCLFGGLDPIEEIRQNLFFYSYELAGTCLVFGAAGFFAGRRVEWLRLARDRFRRLSEVDELTGLPNNRLFRRHLRRALARARRHGEPLSLLMVDVDELKKINDRHGHSVGSAALTHIAEVLVSSKRDEDMAARWGGDEFAILMPGAGGAAAARVAHSIVEALGRLPLCHKGQQFPVSVTIGVATAAAPGDEKALFEKADRALYSGKSAGRNRYVCSPEPEDRRPL